MLKSHEKFHSANGKRLILVADDEFINRELLGIILKDEYELLFASNGKEALEIIWEHQDTLSLVLLDLMMPVMSGTELLKTVKENPELKHIPIIVLTGDQEAEVESLGSGASDFIPKPYPKAEVILARVLRTIELSEDRQIIQSTERDPLTGLYNREYFYRYAEQFDQHHKDLEMDAIVIDVNHFHMINERFGNAYGDEVLRRIGQHVREMVRDSGGIVCRREADTFMVYCPHGKDYKAILDNVAGDITEDELSNNRVRLRMGVYANADKSLDIERRFDRANMAADTVRNSFAKTIGIYDSSLHERELYAEQLIEDFHQAIAEKQFKVFYQPKFNVRPDTPILASAEALVRWQHPTLGFISPGVFIPLFEENGLIQTLDRYVWSTAAEQIRDWKERLQFSVPVSVNVSRIDMYDPHLIEMFKKLLAENHLNSDELLLEITESAYTQDSEQIVGTVKQLRDLGFRIEMDDFGTGYSSLNMISTLPIDALKLDMQFIRNAFSQKRDTRMLEVIIDIADYLAVPVIAEGVETEEQLRALKAMGCDLVQGYYFSKPIPAEEYERFLTERKNQKVTVIEENTSKRHDIGFLPYESGFGKIAYALSSGFESVYYVDTDNNHYVEFSSEGKYEDLQIERSGADFFADTMRNILRVVYEEDRPRLTLSMQKSALLAQLSNGLPYSLTYRLLIEGEPVYYNMKVVRASAHDDHHIVIGVSNVNGQIIQANAALAVQDQVDFSSLAKALSSDMESIYYVDTDSETYLEFISGGSYGSLKLEITGTHFFDECQNNIGSAVFQEDREKVSLALEKNTLLSVLEKRQTFSMDYRLVIGAVPSYYRMKVIPAGEKDSRHIIIGVSNIDAQITEEQRLEAERQSAATYSRVAQALARDYFSIYYVDIETDHFIEYSSYGEFSKLGIEKQGDDFFMLSRRNMERLCRKEELTQFLKAFTKEKVMRELQQHGVFTMNYSMMLNGETTYARMKITMMGDHHIVVGISNVTAEKRRQQETLTYSSIARALAADYFSIYYVNTETDSFVEYSAGENYLQLGVEKSGEDFFNLSRANFKRIAHPDDVNDFLTAFTKENILKAKATTGVFTLTYRLMFSGKPTYVHLKATCMEDKNDPHIVIGVSNIDEQIKREREQAYALRKAKELANRDALTGVKSKFAFVEAEEELNRGIEEGTAVPFAVAVCDVNDLKHMNDTRGHAAGDDLIRRASRGICRIFSHSPVYRYGGDEFVIIMRGQDYQNREELLHMLACENEAHTEEGDVIVACGASEYVPGQDKRVSDVFSRADAAMYENKKMLKHE